MKMVHTYRLFILLSTAAARKASWERTLPGSRDSSTTGAALRRKAKFDVLRKKALKNGHEELAAAAAATFDEDTICSSDASEEGKTAEERLAARDAARAANDFVDAAADGEQVRPPLHSPETFLHLRESHSKYYRYY